MKWMVVAGAIVAAGVVAGVAVAQFFKLTTFAETPFGSADEKIVQLPHGTNGRQAVGLLAKAGVLSDETAAWRYLKYVKRDSRSVKAGEYAFAGAMKPDDVLERLY